MDTDLAAVEEVGSTFYSSRNAASAFAPMGKRKEGRNEGTKAQERNRQNAEMLPRAEQRNQVWIAETVLWKRNAVFAISCTIQPTFI